MDEKNKEEGHMESELTILKISSELDYSGWVHLHERNQIEQDDYAGVRLQRLLTFMTTVNAYKTW